jgi:molybdate transport system substrate-binding protein
VNVRVVAAGFLLGVMLLVPQRAPASAGEVKLFCSIGVREVVVGLGPQFERATAHKLTVTLDVANALKRRIEAGEPFDVAILTSFLTEELVGKGRLASGTSAVIARSGVGIAIRKGAPRLDVSSPGALRQTLLAAKSIAYSKEGASGIYFAGVVERLGIAEETRPKTVLLTTGGRVADLVAKGEVELGVQLIHVPGAALLGPLPSELQTFTALTAALRVAPPQNRSRHAVGRDVADDRRRARMITCYLRYVIDPYKLADFEKYSRMIMPLAAKYGGTHHGTFLPYEGANNIAVSLFSFPSLAEYERYRSAVKQDEVALAAWRFEEETRSVVSFERSFTRPLFPEAGS